MHWAVCACGLLAACGGGGDSGNERATNNPAQTGSSKSDGGTQTQSGAADGFDNSSEMPSADTIPGAMPAQPGELHADCTGETQGAQRVDVDMYIMLDRSNSMFEETGPGTSKWDAIRSAITEFVGDSDSDGLGVGLQYFPLGAPGIPDACTTDDDCGASGGPCTAKACMPPRIGTAQFQVCLTDADCPLNSPGCADFGSCSLDDTYACFDFSSGGCQDLGDCVPVEGDCLYYSSCLSGDYAMPAVPIAVLPDNGMALVDSLAAEEPTGLTPTPVALEGALQQAGQYAGANPTHRVLAVLATDGTPTDCLPRDVTSIPQAVAAVARIAADGLSRSPAVETYVIGVFAPDEPDAMQNLDQVAAAGGTEHAFIVDSAQDVSQQFLAALDQIRGGSLACEFNLPAAPDGKSLDFNLVNVEFTDAGDTTSLVYVADSAHCGDSDLGWYYDADPAQGGVPTKISVCDTTCDTLKAATDASVEIRLGCAQIVPE